MALHLMASIDMTNLHYITVHNKQTPQVKKKVCKTGSNFKWRGKLKLSSTCSFHSLSQAFIVYDNIVLKKVAAEVCKRLCRRNPKSTSKGKLKNCDLYYLL